MLKKTWDEIYRARKDFFNEHAEHWCDMWYKDKTTGRYDKHASDFQRLFSLLPLEAGARVLDVGCGTGILVPFILERITASGVLYELDFADTMIEVNRSLHQAANIRFIVADAENAPLEDASCDTVICFSCFPHFHDMQKAVLVLSRILKPHGIFAISHFDSSDTINRHHKSCQAVAHDCLPDETTMRTFFQTAGLTIHMFTDEPGFYCILAGK